ncbi:unnamed protein product [Gadus morhua 'NCC']
MLEGRRLGCWRTEAGLLEGRRLGCWRAGGWAAGGPEAGLLEDGGWAAGGPEAGLLEGRRLGCWRAGGWAAGGPEAGLLEDRRLGCWRTGGWAAGGPEAGLLEDRRLGCWRARGHQERSKVTSAQSLQQHQTERIKRAEENAHAFLDKELKKLWRDLFPDYPQCSELQREGEEVDGKKEEQRRRAIEGVVDITKLCLMEMNQEELADTLGGAGSGSPLEPPRLPVHSRRQAPPPCLQPTASPAPLSAADAEPRPTVCRQCQALPPSHYGSAAVECQHNIKSHLKEKFRCMFEGIAKAGHSTPLNDFYTELFITERGSGEVNKEHEVRLIETASRKPAKEITPIKCEDIFKLLPGKDQPIRTIMTTGVAGIGKTVLTHKFTLDWSEDKANHDIHFTFLFTFRELNLVKEKEFSLVELLHHFFNATKAAGICRYDQFQVVFILDGLDECRLPLDFQRNPILTDVTESTSVDVLLTNLIRSDLLPSARIWITTRPAAANQIPAKYVGMVTEVRGFTDPQKEEYFRKRFREENLARTIISHIKISRSLHIMCHIPVFCWITATVLEDFFKTSQRRKNIPKTQMYINFLTVQSIQGDRKYHGRAETDPHWSSEGREIIVSLGKLAFDQLEKGKLIFYEEDLTECGIDSLINTGVNLLSEEPPTSRKDTPTLYQSAVDKALQSENGHLDLFLRFLLGLSLETNQNLLREEELEVFDLKKYSASEEGLLRLLPVVKASKTSLLNDCHLSERCCEALASVLSSTSSSLRELDLSTNDLTDSGVKLLSAGLGSPHCTLESLSLSGCLITKKGCASLASALSSNPSHLKELDLSYNHPGDSGTALLSAGLEDPLWRLDTLSVEHGGVWRLKSGVKKYACELTLDPRSAHKNLFLSKGNRKVTRNREVKRVRPHSHRRVRVGSSGRRAAPRDRRHISEDPVLCRGVGVYLDRPAGTLSFYRVSPGEGGSSDTLKHIHTFQDTFTQEELRPAFCHQERSKVTSAQSIQQHQTELIKRAEENAHAFLDKELKKLWRDLFSDYPQCSESQREGEEVDGKNEEQRRRAIEGVVDITKLCLLEMNQEELADTLGAGKRLLF